jgi:tetratricopeptide (TPR) repeat protein
MNPEPGEQSPDPATDHTPDPTADEAEGQTPVEATADAATADEATPDRTTDQTPDTATADAATERVSRSTIDPDRLAELEEERRFLLRSLSDLERERGAGDVDDHDYQALRDGYTARAASVLHAIDEGRSGLAPKRPTNWKRIIGVTAAVVIFGIVAGFLVARASGQRDPGDTITGGTSPDQVATLLSEGRAFLQASDFGEASKRYLTVLDIDPNDVEALTYAGWVLAVTAQGQTESASPVLLKQSKQFLNTAISIDPSYADPECFLAIIAVQFDNDKAEGAAREKKCLANDPSSDMRGLVANYVDPTAATAG